MGTKKSNKRKQTRHQCGVPVEAKLDSVFSGTQTTDISRGGIGMVSSQKVRPRQKIAVQLDLTPDGEFVLAIGRVKWVEVVTENGTYRFGLHLEEMLPGNKTKLNKYLSK